MKVKSLFGCGEDRDRDDSGESIKVIINENKDEFSFNNGSRHMSQASTPRLPSQGTCNNGLSVEEQVSESYRAPIIASKVVDEVLDQLLSRDFQRAKPEGPIPSVETSSKEKQPKKIAVPASEEEDPEIAKLINFNESSSSQFSRYSMASNASFRAAEVYS